MHKVVGAYLLSKHLVPVPVLSPVCKYSTVGTSRLSWLLSDAGRGGSTIKYYTDINIAKIW